MTIVKRMATYAAATAAMLALAVPMTMADGRAQGGQNFPPTQGGGGLNPPQGGPPGGPGQRGQGGPGAGPRFQGGGMMGMMGGSASIAVDGNFLYIVRGNQILKLDKNSLKVVAQGELPMPQMPQGGFGQNRGGGDRGGNVPPPPPGDGQLDPP